MITKDIIIIGILILLAVIVFMLELAIGPMPRNSKYIPKRKYRKTK